MSGHVATRRRARSRVLCPALLVLGSWVAASGCAPDEVMPPPWCEGGSTAILAAQSVPSATRIPCLHPLPSGWQVASVRVDERGMALRFDSDRAGETAAELRLVGECDVSAALAARSDLPATLRYDEVVQLRPRFVAERTYVFRGGCVTWTFSFRSGASATESVALGDALELVDRRELNDALRETFLDVDL